MRVILVGSPAERERLRGGLIGAWTVSGEFATLGLARASGIDADAILLAPRAGEADQEPLTPREVQVLELLAEGLPNKQIAARLAISDQTVKFHVASLSAK